jgi:hypothetical protein
MWRRLSLSRAGSALRLSQPLSGFLASSSSTALFRAATIPERLSLQSLPLVEVVVPSRGPPAPLRSSTDLPVRPHASRSPRVSPTPEPLDPVAWLPSRPWAPFPRGLPRLPVPLGCARLTVPDGRLHPLRSVPPPANPFASTRANPHRRSLLSWVSSPSETLTEPRILDPPRPVDLRSRPARRPCKTGVARDQRPSGPKSPRLGDTSPQRCPKTHPGPAAQRFAAGWSRRRPRLLGAAPRRLSTASPSPLALDRDRANPTWSDLRGIGAFGSWCISGEIHLPLVRFHASSST